MPWTEGRRALQRIGPRRRAEVSRERQRRGGQSALPDSGSTERGCGCWLIRVIASETRHEVEAEGEFGVLRFEIMNVPSADNPKSGSLVAMSIMQPAAATAQGRAGCWLSHCRQHEFCDIIHKLETEVIESLQHVLTFGLLGIAEMGVSL